LSVATVAQAGAQGSAIYAAVAAGEYADIVAAAAAMGGVREHAYVPDPDRAARYDELYAIYTELYEQFGTATETMHRLRGIARAAVARRSEG
jgi:L-ribulokinase